MVKYSFLHPNPIFLTRKTGFLKPRGGVIFGQEFVDKFYAIFSLKKCEKF
jgi:hypothetical protein